MTTQSIKFDFFGDKLSVEWDGNCWVAPVNGAQYGTIGEAVRSECGAYLEASGDNPEEYEDAITNAVNDAASQAGY